MEDTVYEPFIYEVKRITSYNTSTTDRLPDVKDFDYFREEGLHVNPFIQV